jgi:UDP-N-acetylmuramoyl-tripeptide--D-alanyl-D-alanine ligase
VDRVADRDAARDRLLEILRPGDVVLVKASRGIGLEVLVAELVSALGGPTSAGPGAPRR